MGSERLIRDRGKGRAAVGRYPNEEKGLAGLRRLAGTGSGAPHCGRGGDPGPAHGAAMRDQPQPDRIPQRARKSSAGLLPWPAGPPPARPGQVALPPPGRAVQLRTEPGPGHLGIHERVRSTNLGDNRTLAIPVAHTIYHEVGPEWRARMGIADSLIRISVGIEDCDDLVDDFDRAFSV